MEKRHQVFISSTFNDLKQERAEIIQALLELDCFPAGMEIFPATDSAAWELIKGVIDDSDYYCLIVGGRYGSLDADGLSYTEKEYDYAYSAGKPIVAFLHGKPDEIPVGKTDSSFAAQEKLKAFRQKIEERHHCKFWVSPEDLGGKVSRAIVSLRKTNPSEGWVPGAFAQDEKSRIESAELRAKVAQLESEIASRSSEASLVLVDGLAYGDETLEFQVFYDSEDNGEGNRQILRISWDLMLKYVGPKLMNECSDEEFLDNLRMCCYHELENILKDKTILFRSIVLPRVVVDQISVQFRALGYMVSGIKRRAVSDRQRYWKLTSTGERRLIGMQAVRSTVVGGS